MVTVKEVIEKIKSGIKADVDLSDFGFSYSEIEGFNDETGEIEFRAGYVYGDDATSARGNPYTTASVCGMRLSYDYYNEQWDIDKWGEVDPDSWDGDGDAEDAIISAMKENVYAPDPYDISDDEILDYNEDVKQLTKQLEETGCEKFYVSDDGILYGRKDGMEDVEDVDFDTLTPMTAAEFAEHLIDTYPHEY